MSDDTVVAASASRADTQTVAAAVASVLRLGDVVVLAGELGGGKTAFVAGAVRALGSDAHVTSPTFALVHEYPGPAPVAHLDVYRLARVQDLHDIGVDEYLDGDHIVFVEWGDRALAALPVDHLLVRFELGDGIDDRTIVLVPQGLWIERRGALVAALHDVGATIR